MANDDALLSLSQPTSANTAPLYDRQNVRMFLTSHSYGPLIGLALAAFLLLLGFPVDYRMMVFAGLVCLFWLYRFALGRVSYALLSLASLQHLCLVIMWASHGYGGLASPFLLWLAVVPLLAFLYLSPNMRLWSGLIAMIGLNTAAFVAASQVHASPPVDGRALDWLALVSCVCAALYVSMMALHFSRVLNSRRAIEKEAAAHRETAAALDRVAQDLKQLAADKAAMVERIGTEAAGPLADIGEACRRLKQAGDGVAAADLRSVTEAVRYLDELARDIRKSAEIGRAGPMRETCDLETLLGAIAAEAKAWPKTPAIVVETTGRTRFRTDPHLVAEAVLQVLRHLGQPGFTRPLTVRGSCLPSEAGDYVVIDVLKEQASEGVGAVRQPAASRGSFALALASRALAALGGTVAAGADRADSLHVRIELPPALAG